jgi:hypothetical protein
VFVFSNVSEAGDSITDFSVTDDKLQLDGVFQSAPLVTDFSSATSGGYLILTGTQVQIDIDGTSGGGAAPITLATLNVSATGLTSTNFVF